MASTIFPLSAGLPDAPRTGVPWTIWAGVVGVTSATLGGAWDVAWHRSIGRDSFLTPAHIAIYLCGIIAAMVCGYLILYTTFGRNARLKAESVHVLGLQAPLGAFIAAWGGITMLVSAPFDNWWHAAYGLDVKIVSPPHALLILGIRCVSIGILFLILAAMNRSAEPSAAVLAGNSFAGSTSFADPGRARNFRILQALYLYLSGLMVSGSMFFLLEQTWDIMLHRASAYIAMGIGVPVALAVARQASRSRWGCTIAASVYTLLEVAYILIFPLVHASPKLGPVYFPVTHLVPPKFPILIIVPALALDLLWTRLRTWKPWQLALVSGVVFIAVLFVVEWPFASFLMSKASENRFFGTIYFDFNSRPQGYDRLRLFFDPEHGVRLFVGLLIASVCASISAWIGLVFGQWMRGVQR